MRSKKAQEIKDLIRAGHVWKPESSVCQCGKMTNPPHCPSCGSTFVYHRMQSARAIMHPELKDVRMVVRNFYCRRCGEEFFEDDPCRFTPRPRAMSRVEAQALRRQMNRRNEAIMTGHSESEIRDGVLAGIIKVFGEGSPQAQKARAAIQAPRALDNPVANGDGPPPEWFAGQATGDDDKSAEWKDGMFDE